MNNRFLSAAIGLSLSASCAMASDVLINEILYHPFHTPAQAEDTGQEWVELYNRGTNAVSLHGWKLSKGVEFTFTNVTLPAGGYLVVAASRTNFLAKYPGVTNVVGDWQGRLSNSDDELRLLDAAGEEVDHVDYADSGDWAVRARQSADAFGLRGWDWLAPHDGGGATLELINSSMPNEYGQNWAASTISQGTPGTTNTVVATNTAPFIQGVTHFPLVPRSTETVRITARIHDEQTNGLVVTLNYRNASSSVPPAFTPLAMFDDGAHGDGLANDGLFAATIPAQASGVIIEFYLSATDSGARTRQWPAPARNAPDLGGGVLPPESGANAVYQVDDSVAYSGTQPFYRIIMTETERAFLASIAGTLRNSDAQANGTFVSIDANGTEEHHLTSYRRRGAGSRGAAIPNYRVNFATDHRWKGVTGVNLNSQYTHSQIAGAALAALSGLQADFQKPVQVRVNNLNLVNAGSPQFGSYAQSEVPDGDFAQNHFPEDPNGNVYRGSSGGHTATLAYLGTDPNAYITAGFTKTSNGGENDWSDLINLTDVLNNTPDNLYVQAMTNRVNVDKWMTYFAVFAILDSHETSLGTGQGDDFGLYRGLRDPRFQLLGHDFDTVLNQGDNAGNVNDSIFRASAVAAIDRFLKRQEFAPLYFRALTNLVATTFTPANVSATLDQHLGSWVNAAVIAAMKSFSVARNAGVLAQIPLALTISNALPVQGGYPRTTVNSVALSGLANAVETRSVLVNGNPATWTAWQARWTATATALQPGINRVLVQSLDANGREFERGYIDVWYDDGDVVDVSEDINDDVTWIAADGPYNITTSINVPAGYTLFIDPGTSVYLAPGASLTVAGRLVAQGSAGQHIHIGRNPAVGGNWGSLDFINTSAANRLAWVDFDSSGGSTIGGHNAQIHVNNSTIDIDHCTWPPTPVVEYISFDNSSFVVQNSVFPSYPAPSGPEMLHGVNGIPVNGYGIFRDNYFGHTWGFNDTIDFTGGNRPGAILQIIGNVFDGASDDHLDLDSTDAWIEGNIFLHAHRDPTRVDNPLDTASAISGGVDNLGQNPDWTIINNLFYDVDHVLLNKGNSTTIGNGGGRVTFLFNTVAHVARENSGSTPGEIAVFNWSDNNIVPPDYALGSGMYAAHNIIYDAPVLQRLYDSDHHSVIFENNIFPAAWKNTTNEWTGPGAGNQYADPRLNLDSLAGTALANVTAAQLRHAFTLRTGSPALILNSELQMTNSTFDIRHSSLAFNPWGIAISGEPIGTNTSTSATLNVGPGGIFDWGTNTPQPFAWTAYRWKLDNGPWSAVIPITNTASAALANGALAPATIVLSNLSNGPHTVYVSGRNDVGWFQDDPFVYPTNAQMLLGTNATPLPPSGSPQGPGRGLPTASRTWVVDTNLNRLEISEVLARNETAVNIGGKHPDLVELHNAGAKPVDLGDMSLSDDPALPRKYVFPSGTMIPAGGYLVLIAANGEAPGRLYLGFGLNDDGEGLYLYARPASGGGLVDSVTFGLQLPDHSIGRISNDELQMTNSHFTLCRPTFGSANIPQPTGDPNSLRINEWLAASGEIFQQDFIEIYNSDTLPVALGNLALSPSPMSAPRAHVIAPLSYIAARGWQTFLADGTGISSDELQMTNAAPDARHLNFKLSAEGGWIGLSRPDPFTSSLTPLTSQLIDMVVYATQFPDISQGRSPDGTAAYVSFNQPTPGGGNPGATVVISAVTTTVVPLDQVWRMEASGLDLGTGWRANNYNDSGWFSGAALFYNDDSGGQLPPIPQNSVIPFTNPKQTTVYFRSTFNYAGPLSGVNFLLSQVLDDGCVLYLNNQEIYRFGFAQGVTVTYASRPPTVSGTAPLLSGIPITMTGLVAGTNYLAIEVHQATLNSSDMAMAIGIEAQQLVTNFVGTPLVLNEVFTKNSSFTNASGKTVDWVELYNPSTNLVDISDLSLTDDPSIPRRWVFPQGATVAPGGYYVVEFDDSLPYSPFNAGFELSADSGAVYLFQRATAGGGLLDSVVYGVQVADLSLSRATPGANLSWTLGQPTRGAANVTVPLGNVTALKINEWMPNPPGGEDDWFELFNAGSQPVALGGLHLTDTTANPVKHTVRALSFIGSGTESWLKFIADDDTSKGADHVGFRLGNTESIGLYTAAAVPALLDLVNYTNAQNGVSQGRLPDGNSTNIVSFPDSASPEEANWLPLLNSVVINEVLTHPVAPLEQAIELRNPGEVDVAIGGWFLSNAKKDLKRYLIPPGTVVPADGFRVFYEAQFNPGGGAQPLPPSFALNPSKDDEVILSVADANGNLTGYRTRVKFGPSAENVSFGRYEKSTGEDFVAMSARTFGDGTDLGAGTDKATGRQGDKATVPLSASPLVSVSSGQGAPNAYPLVGPIVINEIHYHPPDGFAGADNTLDEFIEILNASGNPVALFDVAFPTNTWRLRDAVDFNFPTNVIVPAWDYVVVVSFSPTTNAALLASFQARHGLSTNVVILGPWSGKLDNSSDSIELLRPDAPVPCNSAFDICNSSLERVPYILVERVKYSDSAPWPSDADGNTNGLGISLQRLVATDYGNDAVNWIAGVPTPAGETGPAAGQGPTINAGPTNRVVLAGVTVVYSVDAAGTGPLFYQWRFNGVAIPGATNEVFMLPNVQSVQGGNYSVTVGNGWGAAFAGPARLSVQAPPLISQQPQSRTVLAGVDTTFIVTASGGALGYQWRFTPSGGAASNIAGATNAVLTVANAQLSDAGGYDVRVNNGFGATTSQLATLTVLVPPGINPQPTNFSAIIGTTATFTGGAVGTLPLSYQWRFTPSGGAPGAATNLQNSVSVSGATSGTLTLSNVQPVQAGGYTLVVTNIAGAVTSVVASLTVVVPPTVSVVASDASASEPGPLPAATNMGVFTFTRTGGATQGLVVHYTISGSAVAGSDYVVLGGTVSFAAGVSGTNVLVVALDDGELEGDETVVVSLAADGAYLVGGSASASVVIRDDDNPPPGISILTPTNGQLFLLTPANVSLTVEASDANGPVAGVEYYAVPLGTNGVGSNDLALLTSNLALSNRVGESVLSPFSFTWSNAPAGSNVLVARALDALGASGVSEGVWVVLNARPTVAVVSPVPGATFSAPASFSISASAGDVDGVVTQVSFYANGLLAGTDSTASPFSVNVSNVGAGGYGLSAVAWDDRGVASTSAVVSVVVNQPGVFDDFEPDIDLSQWSVFGGVLGTELIATNYGGSVSGTHSLWFGGDSERSARTRALDTSLGGTIVFQLRIAGANGGGQFWEQADISSGEAVVLEYSVNGGGSWTVIATYDNISADYTMGWVGQQYGIPAGAQSPGTLFRWRQLSHSGGCCDHWAIDDVQILVGPTPPTIATQPSDQYAVAGGAASFGVTVFGSAPFGYQWRHEGTNLLNATNATLLLNNVSTNDGGLYSVLVTNLYGRATSAVVSLTVVTAGGDYFRVLALGTSGSSLVEHNAATGDDRGGIATSGTQVFVTGDSSTGRFAIGNLGGGTSVGNRYDALVGDLRSETAYAFGTSAVAPAQNGGSLVLTHLLELNGNTGVLNGNAILLTTPIVLNGSGNYGFFSGYGRVVVHNGERVYHIAMPSGVVSDLGAMAAPQHTFSESWGYWGVAELDTNGVSLVYVFSSQSIVRTHVPSGVTTTLATFSSLSDMASMTVSVPRARWYFHHEGSSQFGGSDESVGYADAQFALSPGSNAPPVIVIPPQNTEALRGSNALFFVAAVGAPTIGYQWRLNDMDLAGAVGPTLSVFDVQADELGTYTVVITNQFGSITSAPVTLMIQQPPVDHFEFSTVPSPQTVDVPFGLTITARNGLNQTVTNFEGTVALGGFVQSGTTSTSILSAPVHVNVSPGDYTLGYSFTPNANLTVTGVRHYFGTKVSIWTDAGILLVAQPVTSVPGTWVETPLAAPLLLMAGTTYRVAAYTGGGDYYWRFDLLPDFPDGTIDQSYDASGDAFPISVDSVRWWFVDLSYSVGALAPVAIAPTTSGVFSNGVWMGNMTVSEPALGMFLTTIGRAGFSTNFDVVAPNDIRVLINDLPDPVAVSDRLTNIITLNNSGPLEASAVTVTNFLPPTTSFVSATPSQGGCVLVGNRVECALGSMTGGTTATVTVVTIPGGPGEITNRVGIGRGEADGFAGNNTAQSVTTVLLPALSITDAGVVEGNSGLRSLIFAVRVFPASPTNVSVNYATADLTAEAGTDYLSTNGVVVFAAGQTNQTITVQILGDTTAELHETFLVNLSNIVNASLSRTQAIGTIFNDEVPPQVYLRSTTGAPWGSIANETAMDRVFGTNNWQDLRYEDVNPASVFTPANRFIYMEGSDSIALEMQAFLTANLVTIENWVAAGGRLFLNAAPNEGSGMNFGFGVTLVYSDSTSTGNTADPLHPIFAGPFTPVGTTWSGNSFGHATVTGSGLAVLITNTANGHIVLGQQQHGTGLVLFGGMTTDNFHSPQPEASNLRANIIDYAAKFISCSNCPPTILQHPSSTLAVVGTTVVLGGSAGGTTPLFYQWRFNEMPMAGQTNATLTITNVRFSAVGDYRFVVSNAFGMETSAVAALTLTYGASTSNTVPLMTLTGTTWRYHTNAGFLSGNLSWTGSNYNDSAWSGSGRGLLAWEPGNAGIQALTNTWLALGKTSYYFRTYFNAPTNFPVGTTLRASTYIDDGAVIFINGQQVQRVRMTSGTYGPTTFANAQAPNSGDAALENFYWLASTNLVRGSNVIAAEVHQQTANSSDVVWGMALDALVPIANRPPVITNHPISKMVSNGVSVTFTVGATGTAPLTYQWRRNGTNLPGATSTTLLLTNVQRRHAGVYAAVATNPYDTAVSSNATLIVLVPPIEFKSSGTTFTAPGQFTLSFSGDLGAIFAVESSTNLVNWTQVGTVTNTTGSALFNDNSAGSSPYKFYRLRLD